MQESPAAPPRGAALARMALLALGVVYGDIGTSPLYALRECFYGPYGVEASRANVLGVLSLILWSLLLVVSLKYLVVVLRADNRGEGGILALTAVLGPPPPTGGRKRRWVLVSLGLFGAALLYGDGMITPAISVLSAVEGLGVATPVFDPYIIPITIAILVGLFMIQRHGTAVVGGLFGPVVIVWFVAIAALGVVSIVRDPAVLAAASPHHAVAFFRDNGARGYLVLGSVFLVVTGGEALYADMGHFGARPIRVAWYALVLPALLLNYFGQGAYLLDHREAARNTFYALAPAWALYPLVALATMATVIASQAVISGVFSLTMQAVQLGYAPRVRIEHTSAEARGQIYIAPMNWLLLIATVGLVLGFRSSSNLAAAYGVAVTMTMVITTLLLYHITRRAWKWPRAGALAVIAVFLAMDLAFFGANIVKVMEGGWFPLVVALGLFTLATTWHKGRRILAERVLQHLLPLKRFLELLKHDPPTRVPGTAVFMTGNPENAPLALVQNLKHNKTLHERVIMLTLVTEETPRVPRRDRMSTEPLDLGFHRAVARYGFMEEPDVPALVTHDLPENLRLEPMATTFFLGRETLLPSRRPGMAQWRKHVFTIMAKLASPATLYYHIPPNRVIEVGTQLEL